MAPPHLSWFGFLKETLHHWTPEKLAEGNNGALEFLLLILHVMISRLNTILLLAHASQSQFSLTHASEYCMVHVEIVLISKHKFYLHPPDGHFWAEGNHSVGKEGILR